MKRLDLKRVGLGLAAPVLSIGVALLLTTLILLVSGAPVLDVWAVLFKAPLPRQVPQFSVRGTSMVDSRPEAACSRVMLTS